MLSNLSVYISIYSITIPRPLQPSGSQSLSIDSDNSSTCPQTEVKDHSASFTVIVVTTLSPPAVVDFLDQNYHNNSVTIKIAHNAGLVPD